MKEVPNRPTWKLLMLGDPAVGKSSLLLRFTVGDFQEAFISSIGVDYKDKTMMIAGREEACQIWDTAGQERFRTITSSYYRGAHGVCLTFDLTEPSTFKGIGKWLSEIEQYAEDDVEVILVGNKVDRREDIKVNQDEIDGVLQKYPNIRYFACSAKANTQVSEAFETLAAAVVKTWEENAFVNK
eukprot:TRINITY_DN9157_c0_g1_i1.p1 TRINITY_DN9157_c0_g1~~TRINITY_DN9157_c0_g1_i1.p1  ORF type:complete len:213 (+),score=32.84 TRINITY_DN9157_c0_g1_i1:90-641(+)